MILWLFIIFFTRLSEHSIQRLNFQREWTGNFPNAKTTDRRSEIAQSTRDNQWKIGQKDRVQAWFLKRTRRLRLKKRVVHNSTWWKSTRAIFRSFLAFLIFFVCWVTPPPNPPPNSTSSKKIFFLKMGQNTSQLIFTMLSSPPPKLNMSTHTHTDWWWLLHQACGYTLRDHTLKKPVIDSWSLFEYYKRKIEQLGSRAKM